jgi:RNA polymerase sigma-70 factor (ECF subfamily)
MELTDAVCVTRARTGDTDAYRVLVERHGRSLFRLAFRMTGNEQDAEDVVQESFLRAYRQLGKFDERASFGTWLYRIATNCSLDLVRSRKRRSEHLAPSDPEMDDPILSLPSGDPTPERFALSGEVRERVAVAMGELSATETNRLRAAAFRGHVYRRSQTVSWIVNRSGKHSVFRAVQKLRRALEPLVSTAK